MFNWKDWAHPSAGGAEEFTHRVTAHWADSGHTVHLITARGPGQAEREEMDGVGVTRVPPGAMFYRNARRAYEAAAKPEVVLDEVNTRPFLTPRYARRPVVALIHQLAREYWFEEVPFPLAWLGYHVLEPLWLRSYRDIPVATVSKSTAEDLAALGFRRVEVVPEGCSIIPRAGVPPKAPYPSLAFLGRLTRAKRPHHALEAFALVRERLPEARLTVVGEGYMRESLERSAPPGVRFTGRVGADVRERILSESHVLLVPGVREGWGLVVTEAAALGTPAVAYDVPGLRDSVQDGVTGKLTRPDPSALAAAALGLLGDREAWRSMAEAALGASRSHAWSRTAEALMAILRAALDAKPLRD